MRRLCRTEEINMVEFGKCNISVNDRLMDRLVRESVIIIDAMDSEHHYLFDKHLQHHDLIDSEARNSFSQTLTVASLKCESGFNMYVTRDYDINKIVPKINLN